MGTRPDFPIRRWALFLSVPAVLLAGCDWTMEGYGPAHTGENNSETAINVGNVATLAPKFVAPRWWPVRGLVTGGRERRVCRHRPRLVRLQCSGTTGCSGAPKTCAPLWTGEHNPTLEEGNSPAGRERDRLFHREERQQPAGIRRKRRDRMLGEPEGLQSALDLLGEQRLDADRRERHRLCRESRVAGIRRKRRDELFGHTEGLQSTVDQRRRKLIVARNRERDRLRRGPEPVDRVRRRTA